MKRLSKEVNKDNKPVVTFFPPAKFFNYDANPKYPMASVFALNHPILGTLQVRTSLVLKKFKSGAFETVNTFYVPLKEQETVINETVPTNPSSVTEEQLPKAHSMHSVW